MQPELDYAYLADYAVVQEGKLTAIGASYTHVRLYGLPAPHQLFIAGRIRAPADIESVPVMFSITAPEKTYELTLETVLQRDGPLHEYDNKVGILFALSAPIVLVRTGLYVVRVLIDGEQARRLAFDVSTDGSERSGG